jgi:hypothetical protein
MERQLEKKEVSFKNLEADFSQSMKKGAPKSALKS